MIRRWKTKEKSTGKDTIDFKTTKKSQVFLTGITATHLKLFWVLFNSLKLVLKYKLYLKYCKTTV